MSLDVTQQLADLIEASRDPKVWAGYRSHRAYMKNVHGLVPYVTRTRKRTARQPQTASDVTRGDARVSTSVASFRRATALVGVADDGLTWKELRDVTGWDHDQASGALSEAKRRELLVMGPDKRDRCSVYRLA